MKISDEFKLRSYVMFAFMAEIFFILLVVFIINMSTGFIENYPFLNYLTKSVMEELAAKVGNGEQVDMAVKIFINNTLIILAPLLIFSLQLLPIKGIKAAAVFLAAAVGLFLYIINASVVGLVMGVLSVKMNVSYIILLFITMIHGSLELFAVAAGTAFGAYYIYITFIRERKSHRDSNYFFASLPAAQGLVFKLIPLLIFILAAAALIETYISAPLAEKVIVR